MMYVHQCYNTVQYICIIHTRVDQLLNVRVHSGLLAAHYMNTWAVANTLTNGESRNLEEK